MGLSLLLFHIAVVLSCFEPRVVSFSATRTLMDSLVDDILYRYNSQNLPFNQSENRSVIVQVELYIATLVRLDTKRQTITVGGSLNVIGLIADWPG